MTKTKKFITSLRLDKKTHDKLEHLSEELKLTKTEILQRAFTIFYDRHTRLQDLYEGIMEDDPDGAVVIGRPMLEYMLDNLNQDQLKEMAAIIGKRLVTLMELRMREENITVNKDEIVQRLSKVVAKGILGWFDEFKAVKIEERFEVLGTHRNGEHFSEFFKLLLKSVIDNFGSYELDKGSYKGTDISFAATFKLIQKSIYELDDN